MKVKKAEFVISNTNYKNCPGGDLPEYAFIGRSNVGKSSLINMLTNNNKLAKISSKPGKTRLINHFLINDSWYLVDLPGYGWAKVNKGTKVKWGAMIHDYLLNRTQLACLFVLIDARIPPKNIDLEFIDWLGEQEVPFAIIFTKTDKLKSAKIEKNIQDFKNKVLETWELLPRIFYSSAVTKRGQKEILHFIYHVNQGEPE